MRTVRASSELRELLGPARSAGHTVALVPTMGALHEGHLSLIRRARASSDVVVVSLFVNPIQFNEGADLAAYPRDEARDADLAAGAGADLLFAPSVEEIYPDGFSTRIRVSGLTETLEGRERGAAHFDGVATVVAKLLNLVGPDIAMFGAKDAQQVLVVRRMVRDLNIPTRIETCPTVREADGLAMSSRNGRLSPEERVRALALNRALENAAGRLAGGDTDPGPIIAAALDELEDAGVEAEYVAIVDPDTLTPLNRIDGSALALIAARVGAVRLIDNRLLSPVPSPTPQVPSPC